MRWPDHDRNLPEAKGGFARSGVCNIRALGPNRNLWNYQIATRWRGYILNVGRRLPIPDHIVQRLLASVEAHNLVLLCGAGLSIPPPSNLMSAKAVAVQCFENYVGVGQLAPQMREDIEALATYFHDEDLFYSVFLALVPWDELAGPSNKGHAAVCDLLLSQAINSALTTNYDMGIEQWAWTHKVSLRGALNGIEATSFGVTSNPLLKFHGCSTRSRGETLWTPKQLADAVIKTRLDSCTAWMNHNLAGKDILIVGFSSDWDYLNSLLTDALAAAHAATVTMIDYASQAEIAAKAPALWGTLSQLPNFAFHQASSDAAMEEIRIAFSKMWIKKLLALGKALYEAEKGPADEFLDAPNLDAEALYELRTDAEGVAPGRAARIRAPGLTAKQTGHAHLLLTASASSRAGSWYVIDGKTIRVVQGAGDSLSSVKERFREPPSTQQADFIVCVGALDDPAPGRLIASGKGQNVLRPEPGGDSRWLTMDEARKVFAL